MDTQKAPWSPAQKQAVDKVKPDVLRVLRMDPDAAALWLRRRDYLNSRDVAEIDLGDTKQIRAEELLKYLLSHDGGWCGLAEYLDEKNQKDVKQKLYDAEQSS